jgi:phage terminase large subunit-like protein
MVHTYIHAHTHTHTHTHTHDQQMVYIYTHTHEAVASVFNHSTAQNLPQIHLMTIEYAKQEVMGLKAALKEAHGRHKETEEGALREKTHLQKALDEAQGQIEELRMKVESSAASTPANKAASGTLCLILLELFHFMP